MWYKSHVTSFYLFILTINTVFSGYIGPKQQRTSSNHAYHSNRGYIHTGSKLEPPSRPSFNWDDPQFRPYFDDVHPLNVTSQLGKTAYLQCAIRQLGDRTVSWVRQRDLHILTVGSYTYTSDQRFSCIHREETGTWTLEIKYVRKEDQGVYECQISLEPKLSLAFRLNVQATKAIIPEGPIIQLAQKSQLKLTCLLELNYQTRKSLPSFVFWYKDGTMINYLTGRSELRVISNFIDGHHYYNRSSSVHSSNSQYNAQQHQQDLNFAQLNSNHNSNSQSFHSNHQSSPYLTNHQHNQPNNKQYLPGSIYNNDHQFKTKSSTDFHLSYLNNNDDEESPIDDELFERDDQNRNKEIIVSILTIDGVKSSDSGEYSCKPSYAEFANCTVQVLKDEAVRGGPMSISNQQANIYLNGNYEEEPKSIEFLDDEESFYIMRRSPANLPSNTSNSSELTLFTCLIWINFVLSILCCNSFRIFLEFP